MMQTIFIHQQYRSEFEVERVLCRALLLNIEQGTARSTSPKIDRLWSRCGWKSESEISRQISELGAQRSERVLV